MNNIFKSIHKVANKPSMVRHLTTTRETFGSRHKGKISGAVAGSIFNLGYMASGGFMGYIIDSSNDSNFGAFIIALPLDIAIMCTVLGTSFLVGTGYDKLRRK